MYSTILHAFLAVFLFFLVNLLGHYSPSSLKYHKLTSFLETNEAPAFNYVIRVLTPAVYIIIVSAVLYSLKLDLYTKNIYMVAIYYVAFRTLINILINRSLLVNWKGHIIYSLSIIGLCYFVNLKLIQTKSNILPDFSNMANELWIIIVIFLYNFINNIEVSDKTAEKRKSKYIDSQYDRIYNLYGDIIEEEIDVLRLRCIAMAIIIYEDFNRPKLFRLVEYFKFFITRKTHTLGIMQVMTSTYIGDRKSVELGISKLKNDFNELRSQYFEDDDGNIDEEIKDVDYQERLIERYNSGSNYVLEIFNLAEEIQDKHFIGESKTLFSVAS